MELAADTRGPWRSSKPLARRDALAARFNIAFPELRRATVSRIVAFLGWQGSDPPGPEPEPGSGRPDREDVSDG